MDAQDHWHFHLGYSTSVQGTFLVVGASRIWPKASPVMRISDVWVNLHQNPTCEGLSAVVLLTKSCRDPDDAISGNEHLGLPQHLLPEGLSRLWEELSVQLAAPSPAGRDMPALGVGKTRGSMQKRARVMEG